MIDGSNNSSERKAINPQAVWFPTKAATGEVPVLRAANKKYEEKTAIIKQAADAEKHVRELLTRAMSDQVTGAFSLFYLSEFLNFLREESDNENHDVGIIFVDVDNLKTTNDIYGHEVGDRLLQDTVLELQQLASTTLEAYLQNNFRMKRGDFVVRRSGDEFIVICLNNESSFDSFKSSLEKKMSDLQKKAKENKIGFSYGVEVHEKNHDLESFGKTIREAERKMQAQKEKNKPLLHKLLTRAIQTLTGFSR